MKNIDLTLKNTQIEKIMTLLAQESSRLIREDNEEWKEIEDIRGSIILSIYKHALEDQEMTHEKMKGTEGLEGRKAKCPECGKVESSHWGLPFFQYRPEEEFDQYYCGCRGWE